MSAIKKYTGKHKGYESVSREMLQDKENLSLQAIGLLAHIQSLPDTWTINKTELYKRFSKNGRRSVQNAWNELIENNYVLQFRKRAGKKFDYTYYYSHEKFSKEDIKEVEMIEECSVWDGRASVTLKMNEEEESRHDNDSSTVHFEQSKMGSPKRTVNKLDLKEVYPKDSSDTEDTKETKIDQSAITLSDSEKEKKQDQMLKNTLKDSEGLSDRLFDILDTFSKDYDQMYSWIGIIFRAKDKAEKNTGEELFIEKEKNNELICNGVQNIIRIIRTQEKNNPDGYMYSSLVNYLEQAIAQDARKEKMVEYHYLTQN